MSNGGTSGLELMDQRGHVGKETVVEIIFKEKKQWTNHRLISTYKIVL